MSFKVDIIREVIKELNDNDVSAENLHRMMFTSKCSSSLADNSLDTINIPSELSNVGVEIIKRTLGDKKYIITEKIQKVTTEEHHKIASGIKASYPDSFFANTMNTVWDESFYFIVADDIFYTTMKIVSFSDMVEKWKNGDL